jgi:hypothetical protein
VSRITETAQVRLSGGVHMEFVEIIMAWCIDEYEFDVGDGAHIRLSNGTAEIEAMFYARLTE